MIRDVVVHIQNDQPILVDLLAEPAPSHVALICQNVRTTNGRKPVFVDKPDSTFVIPLSHVRFIEMPRSSIEAFAAEKTIQAAAAEATEAEAEYAERPLARLAWLTGEGGEPADAAGGDGTRAGSDGDQANPDDLDGDLLRRIREV